jgi:hypothetical protein
MGVGLVRRLHTQSKYSFLTRNTLKLVKNRLFSILKIRDEIEKIWRFGDKKSRLKFYSFCRQKNDLWSPQGFPMKKSGSIFLISSVKQQEKLQSGV